MVYANELIVVGLWIVYVNKMTHNGLGHARRTNHVIRGWGFEPYETSPTSMVGKGAID